jgi:capsular exopolysaccharide synthesis family protein
MLKHRLAVLTCLALGASAFAMWAVLTPRIYEATATIVVDGAPPQVLGNEVHEVVDVGPGQHWALQDYVQTQRRVLLSDSMARRVISLLKLENDPDFWTGKRPRNSNEAVELFSRALTVKALFDTQLLVVSFSHRDAHQAKRVVDALVDLYIEHNAARRDETSVAAAQWLADQEEVLRRKLTESELKLYQFKKDNDLLSIALDERVSSASKQIDQLTAALTEAKLIHIKRTLEASELARTLQDDPIAPGPEVGGNALAPYKQELLEEQRKLTELEARYEPSHPQVRQQLARVATVKSTLDRELETLQRIANARMQSAADEVREVAAELEKVKREGLRVARLEVEFNSLRRDTDALSKQYSLVQNRTKETELAAKVKENNLHVLDYARLPEVPVSPRVMVGAIVALLLSLLLAVTAALGLEEWDRTLKTHEDVENKLSLPCLGAIPRVEGKIRVALSIAADRCRLICSNPLLTERQKPLKRILVTGSVRAEGKTLTSISLAIAMAQSGNRVLLIDCALHRPGVKSALALGGQIGFTSVVSGAACLSEAIQATKVPDLYVMTTGPLSGNPAGLADSARLGEILEQCSILFDRVVLDTSPLLFAADPALLARHCDGVVMVVRAGRTTVDQAQSARQILTSVGANVFGVVLNDVEIKGTAFGARSLEEQIIDEQPDEPSADARLDENRPSATGG